MQPHTTDSVDVVTFGETMALFRASETSAPRAGSEFVLGIGGAESNVAIALARLGVGVRWIGRVGDDELGRVIARELRAEQIDARLILDTEAPTGLMVKHRSTGGHVNVTYRRTGSAGSRLASSDVLAAIRGARVLHLTGITPALSPTARDATLAAARHAQSAGIEVSLDLNYRSALWSREEAAPVLRRLIALSDVVFASPDEAAILLPDAMDETALLEGLTAAGPTEAVLKLGERGALATADGERRQRRAVPVNVIDTVGAGDAFVAAYLAERLTGLPLIDRLDTAVTAGALACTVAGDWEAAPTRADLARMARADPVIR